MDGNYGGSHIPHDGSGLCIPNLETTGQDEYEDYQEALRFKNGDDWMKNG